MLKKKKTWKNTYTHSISQLQKGNVQHRKTFDNSQPSGLLNFQRKPSISGVKEAGKPVFLLPLDCGVRVARGAALPDGLSARDDVLTVDGTQEAGLHTTLQDRRHAADGEGLVQLCFLSFGLRLRRIIQVFIHLTFYFTAFICTNTHHRKTSTHASESPEHTGSLRILSFP